MPKGRPVKEFHEYLIAPKAKSVTQTDYFKSPATAFLKNVVEAKSSIDLCIRNLPTKADKNYTKDSLESLQYLIGATLPTIMGHFETFERYLFAGTFDNSVFIKNFKIEDFSQKLKKNFSISFNLVRLSAYRKIGAESIGALLSDTLHAWYDPEKVNACFGAFNLNCNLFTKNDCLKLSTLWQMRHAIVHTGGTLTRPDAQKVKELKNFGGQQLFFENNFIFEVARKLHPIVKQATKRLETKFKNNLIDKISADDKKVIDKFFEVKSSVNAWLK